MALTVSSMTYPPLQAYSDRAQSLVEAQLKKISEDGRYPAPLLEQYRIQAERLRNPKLHECEIVTEPAFGGFLSKSRKTFSAEYIQAKLNCSQA